MTFGNLPETEKFTEILESIGMNKNEIVIYLDLIKHFSSSALDISKRTKLHRSNVYDSLRKLNEKGFIKETIEENKRIFNAVEPEKIKDYLKQKEQEFDLILPQLKSFPKNDAEKSGFFISQGVFAAREALIDLLKLKSDILVYGASKEAVDSFGIGFLSEFHKQRIKNKILMRHIYNKNAIERIKRINKMKYTEARFLSEKYGNMASTNVCGDSVLILIFNKPVIVISIKNKEVADSYRNYFELLWKNAKLP